MILLLFVTYCDFISYQAQAFRTLSMVFHTKWPSFHTPRNQFHTHLIFHSSHCQPHCMYIHLQLKEVVIFSDASYDQITLIRVCGASCWPQRPDARWVLPLHGLWLRPGPPQLMSAPRDPARLDCEHPLPSPAVAHPSGDFVVDTQK